MPSLKTINLALKQVIDALQAELSSEDIQLLAREIALIPACLSLLVDDPEMPVWGLLLAGQDVEAEREFYLLRRQPAYDLSHGRKIQVSLDEWTSYLIKRSRLLASKRSFAEILVDREYLIETLERKRCDDIQRLQKILAEDAREHGLELHLSAGQEGRLAVRILQGAAPTDRAFWKLWAADLSKIEAAPRALST